MVNEANILEFVKKNKDIALDSMKREVSEEFNASIRKVKNINDGEFQEYKTEILALELVGELFDRLIGEMERR